MTSEITQEFNGAWICPDGDIHWTRNIQSHSKVIEELGIRNMLLEKSTKLKWTKLEIRLHKDLDIAYIAMKIGYVRITSAMDQIGILYGNIVSLKQEPILSNLEIVLNRIHSTVFKNTRMLTSLIYLEKFESYDLPPMIFQSIWDFLTFLKKSV